MWPRLVRQHRHAKLTGLLLATAAAVLAVASAQTHAPIDLLDDTPANSVIVDLRSILPGGVGDPTALKILNPPGDPIVDCLAVNATMLYAIRRVDRDTLCREPLRQTYAELCCHQSEPCVIRLQLSHSAAASGSVPIVSNLRLRLLDANDNAPAFRRASVEVYVQEGERGRRIISAEFAAEDPDQGDNGRLTYRLESDEELPFALENSDRRPVALETIQALDRERKERYTLRLLAIDRGSPQLTGTLSLTVLVLDINDEAPTFEQPLYTATVSEDAPSKSSVIRVRAVDRDQGANGDVDYRISPGDYASHFSVSRQRDGSGLVTLEHQLDADLLIQRDRKIDVFIIATDRGSPTKSAEVRLEVTVLDVNDERPKIEVVYLSHPVPENSPDVTVAKVEVKDRDSNLASIRCRVDDLEDRGGGSFVLRDDLTSALPSRSFAGQQSRGFLLRSERPLDRELRPAVQLVIVCVDSGGLNGTAGVRLVVADQNDNPPVFRPTGFHFRLRENTPPPADYRVGIVEARDADEGANARISYALEPSADAEAFRLDPQTGQLFALRPWDREELLRRSAAGGGPRLAQVTLTVTATDPNPEHRDTARVVITIDNVNDNRPQFDRTEYNFRAPENAPAGREVGTIIATDPDDEDNPAQGLIDYVIIAAEDEPLELRRQQSEAQRNFRLDRRSGKLGLARTLDREAQASFVFRVAAIDSGGGGSGGRLTGTVTVTVEIDDDNDCDPQIVKPLADQVYEVPSSTKPGRTLLTMQAVDNDSGPNARIVYSLASAAADSISVDPGSGTVLVTRPLGPPGAAFEATLEARDSGNPPRFARVRVFFRVSAAAAEGAGASEADAAVDSDDADKRSGGRGGGLTSGRSPSTRAVLLLGLLLMLLLLLAAAAAVAVALLRPCRRRQDGSDGGDGGVGGSQQRRQLMGEAAAIGEAVTSKCGFEPAKALMPGRDTAMFDSSFGHTEQHYNLLPGTLRQPTDRDGDEFHQMVLIGGRGEPYQSLRHQQQHPPLQHAHTYYQIASASATAASGFATVDQRHCRRGEADGTCVDAAAAAAATAAGEEFRPTPPFSSVDGSRNKLPASSSAASARRKFTQFNPYADASFV